MTSIHSTRTPAIRFTASTVRTMALAVLAAAALTGAAFLALAVGQPSPHDALGKIMDWTVSNYFFAILAVIVGIAVLGAYENSIESRKTQYDIR